MLADDSLGQCTDDLGSVTCLSHVSHVTQGQEFIYISGSNITAILNYHVCNFSVDNGSKTVIGSDITFSQNGNTYSFDLSNNADSVHSFSLRIKNMLSRSLTFDTYLLDSALDPAADPAADDDDDDNANDDENVKTVFYPVYSDSTGLLSSVFYHYDVDFFTSFDENIFEKMADHELIYRFDTQSLRSVYWFDGFRPETNDYGTEFMPQKMVYSVNMSDLQDVSIGSLFICPAHDPDSDEYDNTLGSAGNADKGLCIEDLEWMVFINGELRVASDYLNIFVNETGSDPSNPGNPGNGTGNNGSGNNGSGNNSSGNKSKPGDPDPIVDAESFQHVATFTNLSLLSDDLMASSEVEFMFYPKGYKEMAVLFVFEREGVYVSIDPNLVDDVKLYVPISSHSEPQNPTLSAMAFPKGILSALGNSATVSINSLNPAALEDFNSENIFEDSDISVHLFVNIDFGNSKDSVNQYLSENGETASLTFTVPKKVNSDGVMKNVMKDELKVFHATETGGQKKLEELNLTISDDPNDPENYYIVTAETTGFSPFAIISVPSGQIDNPGPDPVSSSSSGSGQAVVIPAKNSESPTFEAVPEIPNSQVPSITEIIDFIQGYLSLFSVLVVLLSGMFMWNYIHSRL